MSRFKKQALGALGGLAALLLASDPAGAQNFFEALFGRPRHSPASRSYGLPFPFVQPLFRPFREPTRPAKPRTNTSHGITPVMPTEAKPARLTPDAELVSNLMKDTTLRRGDIVVFPDGPRVFKGVAGSSTHKASDFEDLHASHLVSQSTRSTVLTATGAANASPKMASAPQPRRLQRASRPDAVTETGAVSMSAVSP